MNHPSAPPRSTDGQGLALVVVGVGVCSALHVGKLPVAIPHLQAELALNLVQAGFLLSLVQLAGLSLGLLVGLLADRLGPRRVMLVGLCVLAAGSAGGALAPDVNRLLVFRVVEGAGFLLTVLPAPGLLRLHLRDPVRLSRALAWSGWRATWWLLALCSLAAAAWLALRVPATVAGDAGPATSSSLWPRLKRTLRAPGPWLVALGFLLYSGQWLAVVGFLPTIYVQAGLGAANVAVLSALAAAVNMVGNVAAGRWLARGARPGVLVALGYGAMAAGAVVAFGAVGYPVLQYLAVLLFSAVGGLIPGTLFGVAVVLAPGRDTVSTTVGWMQQFSALGQFIGPPAVAWWVTRVGGWHWTWVLTGACSLLGLLLAVRLQREWTARPGTPAN
jgi:MFS family permease